jgi:N-acetylmuramoyl-L-alanine amidase
VHRDLAGLNGRGVSLALVLALLLAACGEGAATRSATTTVPARPTLAATPSASVGPEPTPGEPAIEPAPGSTSAVYPPNPGAIVVAIDPGHGGCLDWGVPDPSERGVELAEKTLVMDIANRLRDRLEADGIAVAMLRDGDEALAGDFEPDYGCNGPDWRDVDGDGNAGFEETGRIRTRDELQARLDRANLAQADAFVSIHINSLTENGVVFEIAATQTFYDDETPWGEERSAALAEAVQDGVVAALDPLAAHERQDRGTEAVAYYAVSRTWADTDTCEMPGDTWCKPHRGLAMPGILSEVGSITSRPDHDLLASDAGQQAVADGIFDGLAAWFAERELAVRVALADAPVGALSEPIAGDGPPFWPRETTSGAPIRLRVTNTGTASIAAGAALQAGWARSDAPYLASAPAELEPIGRPLPPLEPGESVVVTVELPDAPDADRAVAWISLLVGGELLADHGSAALQLVTLRPAP